MTDSAAGREAGPGHPGGRSRAALTRAASALLRARPLVRAPVWLYRARLGFLFGGRLLMLEHLGRKSGLRRYVVLEVVDHPAPDRWVVASGFGERAQWMQNVRVNPEVRVYLGGRRPAAATASVLQPGAAAHVLQRYAAAHPRAWAMLRPVFEETLGAAITEAGTQLPLVALDLRASVTRAGRRRRRYVVGSSGWF
jgi:deazaflavin-dependent oxidoreductase (nitroreductase family)